MKHSNGSDGEEKSDNDRENPMTDTDNLSEPLIDQNRAGNAGLSAKSGNKENVSNNGDGHEEQANDSTCCEYTLSDGALLAVAASSMYAIIHFIAMSMKYTDRANRMQENYINVANLTVTNSSTCEGSLEDFDSRDDCSTYPPCHDYCLGYFDAAEKFDIAILLSVFFFAGVVAGSSYVGRKSLVGLFSFLDDMQTRRTASDTDWSFDNDSDNDSDSDVEAPIINGFERKSFDAEDGEIKTEDAEIDANARRFNL